MQCPECIDHPGWATPDLGKRKDPQDVCRECLGSGICRLPQAAIEEDFGLDGDDANSNEAATAAGAIWVISYLLTDWQREDPHVKHVLKCADEVLRTRDL